jgi:hypothetical protein
MKLPDHVYVFVETYSLFLTHSFNMFYVIMNLNVASQKASTAFYCHLVVIP